MLYRYGFRVLPFGDPDDDWISLDKTAFGFIGVQAESAAGFLVEFGSTRRTGTSANRPIAKASFSQKCRMR